MQGCQGGSPCALPLIYMLNKNYSSHSVDILRSVLLRYVDDGIFIVKEKLERGAVVTHPAQEIFDDTARYSTGIHHIDVPAVKLQYHTYGQHKSVCLPTKEKRIAHVGFFWATHTPKERQALLGDSQTVNGHNHAIYLGCIVNFSPFEARIPHNPKEIGRETQEQQSLSLWPQRRPS